MPSPLHYGVLREEPPLLRMRIRIANGILISLNELPAISNNHLFYEESNSSPHLRSHFPLKCQEQTHKEEGVLAAYYQQEAFSVMHQFRNLKGVGVRLTTSF